jgi:chromosome segregation ATPase
MMPPRSAYPQCFSGRLVLIVSLFVCGLCHSVHAQEAPAATNAIQRIEARLAEIDTRTTEVGETVRAERRAVAQAHREMSHLELGVLEGDEDLAALRARVSRLEQELLEARNALRDKLSEHPDIAEKKAATTGALASLRDLQSEQRTLLQERAELERQLKQLRAETQQDE